MFWSMDWSAPLSLSIRVMREVKTLVMEPILNPVLPSGGLRLGSEGGREEGEGGRV